MAPRVIRNDSSSLGHKVRKLLHWLPIALVVFAAHLHAQSLQAPDLGELTPGTTKAINALWGENPADVRFTTTKCVVVANLKGPAEITMMHFAYPQHHSSD